MSAPPFLLATCQMGAEGALKGEIARRWPDFRLAYSRPGFVTFKLPDGMAAAGEFDLDSTFARAHCFSLGKVTGDDRAAMAAEVWRKADESGRTYGALHVWQRDTATPGWHDFEPGPTALAEEVRGLVLERLKAEQSKSGAALSGASLRPAPATPSLATAEDALLAGRGHVVLDCVIVEPNEWWIGWHVAGSYASRAPGGMRPGGLPSHAVSRAYLKMEEALWWSRLPVEPGDSWVEVGCAPGGAAQVLLERGARVLGVDPADIHPEVAAHPNFRHLRRRGKEVRRKELRDVRFLAADMNVAPNYTLDTVEALATHESVQIDGMLLTLKLIEWNLADDIPAYLERIRGWGYQEVRARQLQHNRQEICVSVLRQAKLRRRNARAAIAQHRR